MTKFNKYMLCVGIIGSLPPWIQFIKIIETNSSKDISMTGYLLLLIAMLSWLIYGIKNKDKIIIYANIVGALGTILCLAAMMFVQ